MIKKLVIASIFLLPSMTFAQDNSVGRFAIYHGDSLGGPEKLTILLDTVTGKTWEFLTNTEQTADGHNISERYWNPINKFEDAGSVSQRMIEFREKIDALDEISRTSKGKNK